MYENILTEVSAGVGIVTLNRPERHNAIDAAMAAELSAAFAAMAADEGVRVLVLSGTGRSFCAGADLADADALDGAAALGEMLQALAQLAKPTIARVQGPAYGGGVGLVAACDVAIATYDSRFTCSELKLGILPSAIAPHLIAAIGSRQARRYLLSAETFAAAEAYRLGLLHEIVPDEASLDEAVGEIVDRLLGNGPLALAACKAMLRGVADRAPGDAAQEAREGVDAFLQKRPPRWISNQGNN